MPNSQGLVTVLVTNHHVIHNLNEAMDATYQFSYIRSDSVDTPDPIKGVDLIPANPEGFSTCMEIDRVSVSSVEWKVTKFCKNILHCIVLVFTLYKHLWIVNYQMVSNTV